MASSKSGAGVLQPAILATVVLLFLASPNLLHALNIPYSTSHGPQWAKIHPAFYAVLGVLAALACRRKAFTYPALALPALALTGATLLAILSVSLSPQSRSGGGELSALIVTFLLPGLLLLALVHASARTLEALPSIIAAILAANSITAIFESLSGLRLLPFVAGDAILAFDKRPTALLGHPLTNATLTGAWILVTVMRLFPSRLRSWPLMLCSLHLLALFVFAGRVALAVTLTLCTIYVLSYTFARMARGGGGRELLRLGMLSLLILCIALVGWQSGLADLTIARFSDGRGSNETRLAALQMLSELDVAHWWSGAPVEVRSALQARFGSPHGIELSWVALIMTYGLPIAVALLAATIAVFASLILDRGVAALLVSIYFLATSFSSLSIGSKSFLISQFIVILLCIPPQR